MIADDETRGAPRRRGRATFRERDVKAAIKAVRATGAEIAGVEIAADGRIRVIVGREDAAAETNPWDAEA